MSAVFFTGVAPADWLNRVFGLTPDGIFMLHRASGMIGLLSQVNNRIGIIIENMLFVFYGLKQPTLLYHQMAKCEHAQTGANGIVAIFARQIHMRAAFLQFLHQIKTTRLQIQLAKLFRSSIHKHNLEFTALERTHSQRTGCPGGFRCFLVRGFETQSK